MGENTTCNTMVLKSLKKKTTVSFIKTYLYLVEFSSNIHKQRKPLVYLAHCFYFQVRFSDSGTGSQQT